MHSKKGFNISKIVFVKYFPHSSSKFQIRDRVGPPAGREIFQVEALELEETVEVAKTRRCC